MKRVFIIGAMRSGTSSLATYLKQHPKVFGSRVKEPNYMIFHETDKTYSRTNNDLFLPPDYSLNLDSYNELYSDAGDTDCVVDASSSYISSAAAANAIRDLYPDAYIIATLREPVSRALSAFKFNRGRGTEHRENFLEALQNEAKGENKNLFVPWRYLHCGNYGDNLKPYFNNFPRDRIFIQDFQDFKQSPGAALVRVSRFLGLDDFEFDTSSRVNSSAAPNSLSRAFNKLALNPGPVARSVNRMVKSVFPQLRTTKILMALENPKLAVGAKNTESMVQEREFLEKYYSDKKSIGDIIKSAE